MTNVTAKKSEATLLRPPFNNNTSEGTKNRINTNRPGVKLVPPTENSIGGKNIPISAIHTTSIFPRVDARDVLMDRPLVLSSAIILTTTLCGLRLSAAVSSERLPPAQLLQSTHRKKFSAHIGKQLSQLKIRSRIKSLLPLLRRGTNTDSPFHCQAGRQ